MPEHENEFDFYKAVCEDTNSGGEDRNCSGEDRKLQR